MFFVESSENSHLCPVCQGILRYRDSRPRIRKKEGGVKERLMIRRFRCQNCHSYHNELPDCLVPYKHYESLGAAVPEEGISPLQEWNRAIRPLTFLDAAVVSEAFLHHEQRKVDKGACISFRGKRYETNPSLIGHTVEISYDPAAPEQITISYQRMDPFTAVPLKIRPYCDKRLLCRNRPLRHPAFLMHWRYVINRINSRWQMLFPLLPTGRRRMSDV